MTTEAFLLLRIGTEEVSDSELLARVDDIAAWLQREGPTDSIVYYLSGRLILRSGRDAVSIRDDIFGPIQRLCLGSLPTLARGEAFRTGFEASSNEILVEPADGALVVSVTDQDPVAFAPVPLLGELLRIGETYLQFLRRLNEQYRVTPELIRDLEQALPAATAAVLAVQDQGWPLRNYPPST